MDEQVLKDLIATAEASNYNWEEVMPKFPELADIDLQVLKDYVETAKHYDYDYDVVNAKFPELGLKKKDESEPTVQEDVMESTTQVVEEQPISSESSAPQEGDQSVFDAEVEEAPETVTEFAAYDPREESGTPESMAQGIVTSATNPMLRTFVDPADRTNVTYDADATTFERSLAFITPDLIGREEEEVVNRMKYHFTDYGFTFSQTGIGDAMIVKADNGQEIEIDLDPFTRGGEEQGSIELQNFLQQNRRVDPEMEELTYSYDLNRKKYFSRQAVDNDIQSVRAQSEALGLRYQDYLREQGEIDTAITAMTQVPLSERGPDFKAEYDALIQKKSELAGVKGQLQQEVGEFQIYSDKINSAVGNYLTMKEDDSSAGLTFLKAGWNNILSGITGPLASAAGIPMDLFYGVAQTVDEDFGMTEEEKKERYITIATDLGYDIPENIEDDAVYNKWLEGLMESTFEAEGVEGEGISATMNRYPKEIREELEAEGYDPSRVINADGLKMWNNEGGILGNGGWEEIPDYASDTSPGERLKRLVMDQEVKENKEPTKQLVRSLLDIAKFEDVSEERVQAQSESVIVEGMLGLAQSFPSILLGLIGRGKGPKYKGAEKPLAKFVQRFKNYATSPGAVAQTIGFSLLQTDALMQEMENDPDFKYVTETEKKAITVPLAVSTAILETYGLRSLAKGPMMGKLMTQVTKLLPKGATPKMFSETFKKVVESNIAKGVYSSKALRGLGIVGGAAAVEFETGGLQTVAEIGMKNVWNDMYEKEMFNTPEMWSEEFNNQVIRGALAEAVGGFVMGTPRALTTAFNRGDIDEVSDDMVALFNEIRKDGTTAEAYKTQLDLKVANQELTKEEANQALLDFEVLSGAAASIEKGTELTPTQTKKALGLVYLKNKLESEMDGMDPDLGSYKAKQEMLVTIKDKLSKIGTEEEVDANLKPKKDAIQESSTTEVDVQKQTEDGTAVGERDATGGVAVESESETEVSPETTEEKVELTVEERAKQIEELVEQEQEDSKPLEPQPIPREQLESVDETVSINKKNAPKRVNPLLDTVKRRVNRAAKAIKRIAPSVKIIMHESAEDFTAATGSRGRGTFLDNTIHINLENASGTTVAHEAFHAILLSKISTDLQAQQVTKRLMQSMAKSLDANSPLKKKIEEFVEGYDENIKNEERLAQVLGELSSNYTQLKAPEKSLVRRWIDKLSKRLGYEVSEFTQEDQDVVDLLNTLAAKVTAGVEVEEGDVEVLETEQGDGGEVGTLKVREQKDSRNSPKVETDKRSFAKFISNKDLGDFDGRDFVTNMYDFTTAGVVDIGNGITLDLQGGKSYVPFMMEKQGLSIGDVSNLAAFNTKAQAESFIRNSEQGNAKLFMPHAGTIEGSWQFQQSIFEQLMNAALDNKILSKKDIINSFNEVLTNEVGKKAFAIFKKKLGKNIRNFNSFSKNPLEIVELLNTTNNFSPELRKALNDKLSANKKYQAAIGVKSKEAFALKLEDPLNKGVEGGDLMGVVEFDNTNFEISKPKPGDADYHPSFAWTVKAKIEGVYQPTKFYKSYDVTDEYTKYNQSGPNVSRKAEQTKEQFIKTNVMSSPGSIPKVAKVAKREQKEVRFQKIADKFQDPVEIIKLARTAGFEDSEIKYFLQKTKKLKVKEINDLLKVDVDMFASMPAVFGNVPGGMVAGRKLYEATMKKFNSLLKKNLKRPKDKQASMADMINESIEFMMGRKAYKEATEGVKSKTELSTLQQQLQASMQEALGGGKVKDISKKIKELKKIVRQKIRGAREVRDVKRQLQRTIREVLPKAAFNKTEVRNLLRTIQDAEPKWLKGNLRNLTEKIESLAAEKNVSILNKAIQKILDNKFLVKVGGLEKLIKIDQATYKIVESIKDKMYKAAEVKDDIIKEQTKLIEQVEGLNRKLELTEEEETELLVLNIALGINNAKLMEDSNPRKADQLAEVYNNLKDLITQGRNNYKEAAKERSKRYAKNTALFHQALEGYKDVLDFTDPEVLERIRKDLKDRADEKASNYGRNALKEYFKKIGANIDKYLKMGTLGLSQLSSALDKSPGAAFEGFIKDFVYRKVNESTRMYKESMMALDQILTEKTEEYLGKDYAKKIKEYRKSIDFLELQDGKFLKDPQEVKDAQAEFDKDPTRKNKDKLNELIRKNIPFSNLTPLQLQYLYFQYKQKDTHAGFKTSLGDNYESIMDGLSKHFEETYPDLLELGRWQVEVLLPSLYEKYNEVYKKLYNTDLPQRDNYSGRTFRVISKGDKVEMEKYDPLSLLSEQGMPQMGMNVIGNSTKLTQKNSKAIMPVDAFTAIDTYLKDMEHFAAYAENINEISKVFFNKDIVDTIVSIHGQDVYDTIRKQLMATAQRGANQSDKTVDLVNRANNIFIVQKLGAGLTVYLKQLTSIGTYGNFIGYGNWMKTATTMGPKEFIKAAKEISDESVYIKYRYWQQISKTIEAYGEKQMETYTPGDKGNKVLRLLMSPIKAGDKQAIYLGGIPNYVFLKNKFMKQGMSEENAKKKAMLRFEEQTKEVQQSSDKQDKDSIQNEGGLVQTFNMFMSAPKAYLRQIFGGYRELGRNIKDGSGKGTTGENLRTILVYQFAMPMIFQWAGSGFPVTDWDEEDKKDMARAAILSVFNSIFVLGQILEMGADYATGKPWWDDLKQFPVLDLVKDAIKQYDKTNLEDSEKADEAWKQFIFTLMPLASVVPGGGTVAALPFKTLDRMRLNMKKIIQDGGDPKEVFLRLFNYSDYVIEGPEEKEKKPKKLRKSEVDKYMPELSEQMEEFNNDPDYKEMLKDIKDLKKEQEAMRQELLEEMFAD